MDEIIKQKKKEIIKAFNKNPEGPKDALKMLNNIIVERELRGPDNKPLIPTDTLASLLIEEKDQLNLNYARNYLASGTKTLESLVNQLNFKDKTLVESLG